MGNKITALNLGQIHLLGCALLVLAACSPQKFALQGANNSFGTQVIYNTNVDILWSIDDSGSMGPRQQALAAQVSPFVNALNSTGMNYQMAVTTMDMSGSGEKGKFITTGGDTPVLTAGSPNFLTTFAGRINVGSLGSPVIRGFDAMEAAFQAPWTNSGNTNYGFLRSTSLKVLIFVADENDQSAVSNPASFLDTVSPPFASGDRSWVANFVGVLPNDPGCQTTNWQFNSPGTAYINLANASGGVVESICEADYAAAVAGIQDRVLAIITEYKLSSAPDLATLKVYLNGVAVPNNASNGYTYDATSISIRFHGSFVPTPTSTISVTFDPAGET